VRNYRHSNGRTDITSLKIAFRNYANARNYIENILKMKQYVGTGETYNINIVH